MKRTLSLILSFLMTLNTAVLNIAAEEETVFTEEPVSETLNQEEENSEEVTEETIETEDIQETENPGTAEITEEPVSEDIPEETTEDTETDINAEAADEPAASEITAEEEQTAEETGDIVSEEVPEITEEETVPEEIPDETLPEEEITQSFEMTETVVSGGFDNDELFGSYVNQAFGIEDTSQVNPGQMTLNSVKPISGNLSGMEAVMYNLLWERISEIINPEICRTDTAFAFSVSDDLEFGGPYTAADLGVEALISEGSVTSEAQNAWTAQMDFDLGLVLTALRNDHPLEMFWYDGTEGTKKEFSWSASGNSEALSFSGTMTISMAVSADFSASGETGTYVLGDVVETVNKSVQNAQYVIEKSINYDSDYEKLDLYRDAICSMTSYNDAAADESNNTPYGNPWQLIWVFDDDENTTVVCEGYAKAFKYLCDNTAFTNDVYCSLVSGVMDGGTGSGRHMWNLVTMEDGKHYLADITNCDYGTVGYPDLLFMKGYSSAENLTFDETLTDGSTVSYTADLYTIDLSNGSSISYYYNYETVSTYALEDLILSSSDYRLIVAADETHYLVFASDRHNNTGAIAEAMSAISGNISEYDPEGKVEYVSIIGDMTGSGRRGSSGFAPAYNTSTVLNEIQQVFPWLTNVNTSIMAADHDEGAVDDAGILKCPINTPSGLVYTGYNPDGSPAYYIYGISYYSMLNDTVRTGNNQTAESESYEFMNWIDSIEPHVPVIVLCHAPIHKNRNDNLGAVYWNNALNYAATGSQYGGMIKRHVMFLHGHNHTSENGAEYYYAPETTITIQGPSITDSVESKICYTYITAGYMQTSATKNATLIRIKGDTVDFTKYNSGASNYLGEVTAYSVSADNITVPSGTASVKISYSAFRYGDEIQPESTSFQVASDANGVIDNVSGDGTVSLTGNSGSAEVQITCESNGLLFQNSVLIKVIPLSGTCGENLNWMLSLQDGLLNISGTGTMYNYASSDYVPWKDSKDIIKTVNIENGVTSIGSYAFYNCSSLESVSIPPAVTEIKNYAFSNCSSLKTVNISDIEAWLKIVFAAYTSNPAYYAKTLTLNGETLTELAVPDSITAIQGYAFYNNTALTSVTLPDSLTAIGTSAFRGCTSLEQINLPGSLSSLGTYVFYGCSKLQEATIPSGIASIPDNAFYGCTALREIIIPDSVTSIGNRAFQMCKSLTKVTIPDSVTSLGTYAFYQCSGMEELTIGSGLTSVSNYAFYNCSSLKTVFLPSGITTIGTSAFSSCSSLTDAYYTGTDWSVVTVNSNNTYLTNSLHVSTAGGKCGDHLNWMVYTDSEGSTVLSIFGTGAMYSSYADDYTSVPWHPYVDAITKAVIGGNPESFTSGCFANCNALTGVYISDLSSWLNISFGNGSANPVYKAQNLYVNGSLLENLVIPESILRINSYAFCGCTSIKSVTISGGDKYIDESAFFKCSGITAVYVNDLESWLDIDFANYSANPVYYSKALYVNGELLTSLVIPETVSYVKQYAFYNCIPLNEMVLPDNLTGIGNDAFYNCSGSSSLNIPDTVTYIGNYAFYGCTGLLSLEIPDSVTYLGGSAFYNCSKLTEIVIPGSVGSIGSSVFYGCVHLERIILGSGITSIGSRSFYRCTALKSIEIPETITSIGSTAFTGCTNLTDVYYTGTQEQWANVNDSANLADNTDITMHYTSTNHTHSDTDGDLICEICNQKYAYRVILTSAIAGDTTGATVANLQGGGIYEKASDGTVSEVTVKAPDKLGYDFKGWYVGNAEGYADEAVYTKLNYTFTPEDDTELVAVYAVTNSTLTVKVSGGGFKITGNNNIQHSVTKKFTPGTVITLNYVDPNREFLYWVNETGKILSREKDYTFTLVSAANLEAISVSPDDFYGAQSAYVEFISFYNQVISAETYSSGDEINYPAGPSRYGYLFTGWDKTPEEIWAEIEAGNTHIAVRPVYEKSGNEIVVTVHYKDEIHDSDSYQAAEGESITISAPEINGYQFSGWTDAEGILLSTEKNYYLLAGEDKEIYAEYINENEPAPVHHPVVALTGATARTVDGKNKVVYITTRSVPEGYTVVEHGLILNKSSNYEPDEINDAFIIGAEGVIKGQSSGTALNGTYTASVSVPNDDTVIYGRGYLIVQDRTGNETVQYSEKIYAFTFNELTGN